MPSVSRNQQKAMHAAAAGKSTIGIPRSVGQDFAAADSKRGPFRLPRVKRKAAAVKKGPPPSGDEMENC